MNKLFVLILTICVGFMTGLSPVLAVESTKIENESLIWHDISELDSIPYEETYSYEELVQKLASEGCSVEPTIKTQTNSAASVSRGTTVRFALFKMTLYSFKDEYDYYKHYRLQPRFSVGLQYTDGSDTPDKMVSLGGVHIYTGAGDPCRFDGSIFYQLISGREFYYSIYGDLFREGTENWTVSATVNIGGFATVSCNVSNSNSKITNVSKSESYYSSALSA